MMRKTKNHSARGCGERETARDKQEGGEVFSSSQLLPPFLSAVHNLPGYFASAREISALTAPATACAVKWWLSKLPLPISPFIYLFLLIFFSSIYSVHRHSSLHHVRRSRSEKPSGSTRNIDHIF